MSIPLEKRGQAVEATESSMSASRADEPSREITQLMQQAKLQSHEAPGKDDVNDLAEEKLSPFRRGKKKFANATQAFKERIGKREKEGSPTSNMSSSSQLPLDLDDTGLWEEEDDPYEMKIRRQRLAAEGKNLTKAKIRAMMGDEVIPSMPLPVYESMKLHSNVSASLTEQSTTSHHSDVTHVSTIKRRPISDLDLDHHKSSISISDSHRQASPILPTLDELRQKSSSTMSSHRYSNMISGLRQHPNVMEFATHPTTSTTNTTLSTNPAPEPQSSQNRHDQTEATATAAAAAADENKKLETVDEVESDAESTDSKTITDGSRSVKRKSANEDLRGESEHIVKKNKSDTTATATTASEEGHDDGQSKQGLLASAGMASDPTPQHHGVTASSFGSSTNVVNENVMPGITKENAPKGNDSGISSSNTSLQPQPQSHLQPITGRYGVRRRPTSMMITESLRPDYRRRTMVPVSSVEEEVKEEDQHQHQHQQEGEIDAMETDETEINTSGKQA